MVGRRGMMMMVVMITVGWMLTCAAGKLHKVGGVQGWNQNVNYTIWSANQHFYVGEWLIFVFDKRYYNVLEVNKANFEYCNEQGFIKNITRGGRDVYQLKEARPYYFLSSGGYCFQGMKLALLVQQLPPAAPALAPTAMSIASPLLSTSCAQILILSIALSLAFMSHINLFIFTI